MTRTGKKRILMGIDGLIIIFSTAFSYLFVEPLVSLTWQQAALYTLVILILYYLIGSYYGIFNKMVRYTSILDGLTLFLIVVASYIIPSMIFLIIHPDFSFRFMLLASLISVAIIPGTRVAWRILHDHHMKRENLRSQLFEETTKTLVVGAGEAGAIFIDELSRRNDIEIAGLVDDDPSKLSSSVYGVPVLGTTEDIPALVDTFNIDQITIAIPSIDAESLERIIKITNPTGVKVNRMPPIEDILLGRASTADLQEIDVADLLGREEVELDLEQIGKELTGKVILISGAGGSIGSEISRQVLNFKPRRLILMGHGENSIYLINRELQLRQVEETEIYPLIADIQDRDQMFRVMEEFQPDMVYHAAAHKHVPLMEYNPKEAIKNNIYGTKNLAEASKAHGVKKFVMISTDKAVNPTNVMGSTKRIAEMIVTGLNEEGHTNFAAVRFGNVLGSRGSVVPLFREQIKRGGPVTVTDKRMIRYFMTIPEASRLVLQAGSLAKGGEIFILDMGDPVKIVDLAKKMILLSGHTEAEIQIKETGIRPGEKLYEELLADGEAVQEEVYEKILVGRVQNLPYDEVLSFVESLKEMSRDEVRKALVDFANNRYYKEDNEEGVVG